MGCKFSQEDTINEIRHNDEHAYEKITPNFQSIDVSRFRQEDIEQNPVVNKIVDAIRQKNNQDSTSKNTNNSNGKSSQQQQIEKSSSTANLTFQSLVLVKEQSSLNSFNFQFYNEQSQQFQINTAITPKPYTQQAQIQKQLEDDVDQIQFSFPRTNSNQRLCTFGQTLTNNIVENTKYDSLKPSTFKLSLN